VLLTLLGLPAVPFFLIAVALFACEIAGPVIAERRSTGTPWNAHHIAERYGLLAIITLGEGVFGTVAAVTALVQQQGWSAEAVLIVVAGIGLTFGLWWNYFLVPSGDVLERFRGRAFPWGYSHVVIFGAIAATGAGLHIAAYVIEGRSGIGTVGAVLAVGVPVLIFSVALFALHGYLLRQFDSFHVWLFVGTLTLLLIAVILAVGGVPIGWCLLVVTLAPAVIVVGYETVGHRHQATMLARLLRSAESDGDAATESTSLG
jgi:low temperature requirement protein LtrA